MDFKIEIHKEEFLGVIEALTEEKSVVIFGKDEEVFIEIDINSIVKTISYIGREIAIKLKEFDSLKSKEAKLMLLILNRGRLSGASGIELPINDMIIHMFFLEHYYNYKTPTINGDNYIISLDKELNIMINTAGEVERVTKDRLPLVYKVINCDKTVILELEKPLRLFLKSIIRKEEKAK